MNLLFTSGVYCPIEDRAIARCYNKIMNGQTPGGSRKQRWARPFADAKRTRAQTGGGISGVAGDLRTRPPRCPRRDARLAHCAIRARPYLSAERSESAFRRGRYGGGIPPTPCREAPLRGLERPRPIGRGERKNPKHKRILKRTNKYNARQRGKTKTVERWSMNGNEDTTR